MRLDCHRKYGVLLVHPTQQSEAVRKLAGVEVIVRITAALRRTSDAITTIALYTIATGALALFVPLIDGLLLVVLILSQRILDFMPRRCPFLL